MERDIFAAWGTEQRRDGPAARSAVASRLLGPSPAVASQSLRPGCHQRTVSKRGQDTPLVVQVP